MRPSKSSTDGLPSDGGSASLEFITAGLILLVPLVYLILAMAALQGGSLALEGAARHAARVFVQAPNESDARARVGRVVELALADYDVDATPSVQIQCDRPGPCLTRQGRVTVTIRAVVPMPLVPSFLGGTGAAGIPIEASATQTVSRFWGAVP
ncbi:hypothetical protein [Cryobacterium tepidiphilum]|uniref:TadE family protein n=1 Tax=Cryobacterium tepidiphilum TaxID=2486026 RepID=A0A3M8L2Q6_9MICO|nr:hypothetical protein [Cryobacterium tepidiphilum]RNE59022.1 hypothetical protein EEJ31_11440 [Cryobacterium tepidiphilum]